MRGRVAFPVVALVAVLVVPAASAGAVLTPIEQAWAKPLIKVWNVQNQGLRVVIAQATTPKAMIAGEKPANLALTNTLAALLNCKLPTDLIKKAGAPPSSRLVPFRDALNAACIHDQNGANDFAKAIGAVSKGKSSEVTLFLKQGAKEFAKATLQLAKAYNAMQTLGGSAGFKA